MERAREIPLFNPSDFARGGHVAVAWSSLELPGPAGAVRVVDWEERVLPSQLDVFDPARPERSELSFTLAEPLPPGDPDYTTTSRAVRVEVVDEAVGGEEVVAFATGEGVKLRNRRMEVWLPTVAAPGGGEHRWFAGSATSVVLFDEAGDRVHEVLDAYGGVEGDLFLHDPEKRAMQLDRLEIPRAAWEDEAAQSVPLYASDYETLVAGSGPVRAITTIVSAPFLHTLRQPAGAEGTLTCRLYREITLEAGAQHLVERLRVRAREDGDPIEGGGTDLLFVGHYFAFMRFAGGAVLSRFPGIPGWFSLTSRKPALSRKFHGYGFAADAHARAIECPAPAPVRAEYAVRWELEPSREARCLHLFRFHHPEEEWGEGASYRDYLEGELERAEVARRASEDITGRAWYENVYKPIRAGR